MGSSTLKLRIILLYTFTFEKSGNQQTILFPRGGIMGGLQLRIIFFLPQFLTKKIILKIAHYIKVEARSIT